MLGPANLGHAAEFVVGPDATKPAQFAARTHARVVAYGRFDARDFAGMAGDWAILRLAGGPVVQLLPDGTWIVVGMIQQSLAPVAGVLSEYAMQHRNQMIAVGAFRRAIDAALRAGARRLLARGTPAR